MFIKKTNILFTIVLFVFSMSACQQANSNADELKTLYKEVMAIHDEVMPEIGTIRKLHKTLRKHPQKGSNPAINSMLQRLNTEDEAMMDWMNQFKQPNYDDYEATKKYLTKEKERITKVKEGMLSVIKEANSLINSL